VCADTKSIEFLFGESLYRLWDGTLLKYSGPVVSLVIVILQLFSRNMDLVTFTSVLWVVSPITFLFMLLLYTLLDRRVLWCLFRMPEFLLVQAATFGHALLSAYFLMSFHDDIIAHCGGFAAPLASRWFWQGLAFFATPIAIASDALVTRGRFKNIFAVLQVLSFLNGGFNYLFVIPHEPWIRPASVCVYGAVCVDVLLTRCILVLFLIVAGLRNLCVHYRSPKAMTYIWADISFAVTPLRQ
jgi:hypothetical protein